MTIVDANLLIYVYGVDAPQHTIALRWWQDLLETEDKIGIPWVSVWAFLRVNTNPRLFDVPRRIDTTFAIIESWLQEPGIAVVQPGPRHASILRRLTTEYAITGPLITDAVLAALAIENGATLASADQDFRRFPEVRWVNPLETKHSL